jgi:putative nucleotidyltransferase with HDIG domain
MASPMRQFENTFRLLTTLVLTFCALGIILIPGHLGIVTNSLSKIAYIALGITFYITGIINQTFIFLARNELTRKLLDLVITLCLGILGYLYFQANLVVDGILLIMLVCGQLYILIFHTEEDETKKNIFSPGYAVLNLIIGCIVLLGLVDFSNYENLWSLRYYLGSLFILGSLAGAASFFLYPQKISKTLYKFTAIPWLIWVLVFLFASQVNTSLVAFGVATLPLVSDVIPWDGLQSPNDNFIGRRIVRISSAIEFFVLISLVAIGYNWQFSPPANFIFENIFSETNQEILFVAMFILKVIVFYGLIILVPSINQLTIELSNPVREEYYHDGSSSGWSQWIARSLKTFTSPMQSLRAKVDVQAEQIAALSHQLSNEKKRNAQLNLLAELTHQLEAQLDQPVAAQLAVNTLQRALNCTQATIYENELERRVFSVIASAGKYLPPSYRQNTTQGILGRTLRLRKTQVVNDSSQDPAFIEINKPEAQSVFTVPLIYHGHVKAVLEVGDDKTNAFSNQDVYLTEMIATELTRAWERSSYHQRLTNLIKAGISLSPLLEPQTTITEIASIAREILLARFTYVVLLDQDGNFSRTAFSGHAPRLLKSLDKNPIHDTTVQAALHAYEAFRVRDVRKYSKAAQIEIDHNGLRSLLAIPVRLHRLSIGAILAFGKQGEIFFSENDESLANLLSSQAANAVESAWLYQELRNTLSTTTQLYNLSVNIIKAKELDLAARHIAETATKITGAAVAGIVLFTNEGQIEVEVEIDESGVHPGTRHPMELIQQTLQSGQTVHVTPDQVSATICFPLQTPLRKYGALWLNVPKIQDYFSRHAANMQTLANQAILALERSILQVESQQQAKTIELAYEELELAYDNTLIALTSALDARDRETEGHSSRVSRLTYLLGLELGLNSTSLKTLERGSLLHDIGKIGISDVILHKPGPLSEEEWEIMHTHPDIGARIVEGILFLQETLPIIRYHHERWDGSGYPVGIRGKDIPFQARIFAVTDAFDALTSDRPYRKHIPDREALQYLRDQAGILFDPEIVAAFERVWEKNELEDHKI